MDSSLIFIFVGLTIGALVGLTGLGGAALMTPVLIFLGLPPTQAVGIDLIWATVTKFFGGITHIHLQTVKWSVVGYLALGSIPGALIGVQFLKKLHTLYDLDTVEHWLKIALGTVILFVAAFLFFKSFYQKCFAHPHELKKWPSRILTVLLGLLTGVIVALTSVGSGTLVALFLLLVCPLGACRVVGTDIVHAVILTAVAGVGHFLVLQSVDWQLVGLLLAGSIPGVLAGSWLSLRINTRVLSILLAVLLFAAGVGLLAV